MSFKKVLPFVGVFFLFQTACVDDSNQDSTNFQKNLLFGRWEIVEAFRNGKKTETLADTFYNFEKSGDMVTNLTPTATSEKFPYQFDGKEIVQKGGAETVFKVEELSDTSLTMSMIIQKFPFKLVLAKVVQDEDINVSKDTGILQ